MSTPRVYHDFTHHEAVFRICCSARDAVIDEIIRQRRILETYIQQHPDFRTALTPLNCAPNAPTVVKRMVAAGVRVGVGPMAAVAGTMAQLAGQAGLDAGADEAIIENGGDIFAVSPQPVTFGLYAGTAAVGDALAFAVSPEAMPIAICSSSSRMGHSMSLGDCDLATVVADDAALADAAATEAANRVRAEGDLNTAAEAISAIPGVRGVLLAQDAKIALAGKLPQLVRAR